MRLALRQAGCKPCSAARKAGTRGASRSSRTVTRATAEVKDRKPSPLEKGGTLSGDLAAGKDASAAAKSAVIADAAAGNRLQIVEGRFVDDRWVNGTWDYAQFKGANGEVDWDLVIDAEIARRKLLERSPIPSTNEDAVFFDTNEIPWWAWVRRFHLPEAEKLNGRAAMIGYFLALVVDQLTGTGLLDQQNSFLGKLLLHLTVFGVLLIRTTTDIKKYQNLLDEATFYDKQWQASWEGIKKPSETEQ